MTNPFFGVKALIFYNRTTGKPVGAFQVISTVEFGREIEPIQLKGGHHNGAHAVEPGEPENSLTATLMEFPNFAFTELDNATKVDTTGEDTTGLVGVITNKSGSSVANATNGIASVALISNKGALLPLGKIVLVAASSTTVDIYLLGDTANGSIPIVNELTLLQAGVTISGAGSTIDIAAHGFTIASGSGVTTFVQGETAIFDVRPANSKTTVITMGDNSDFKTLGCILVQPKSSNKVQRIFDIPKIVTGGLSFASNTREFSEVEITGIPLVDDVTSALYTMTEITASN